MKKFYESKIKPILNSLYLLMSLNYCVIFGKCFNCKQSKGGRLLFCSVKCAIKTVRGS